MEHLQENRYKSKDGAVVNNGGRPKAIDFIFNLKNFEKRDFGLDLIKVVAMFFVPSVHFFLYNGYYSIKIQDADFIFPTMIRDLFFLCVPLFMLVTGALSHYHHSDLNKRHYVKATPVIINSLVIGVIVVVFKLMVKHPVETMTPYSVAQSLWSFTQPSYGWYVNMYLSLFVIMPILDAAYSNISTQKKRTYMIIALIVVTCLPMAVNRWKFEDTSIGMSASFFASVLWPVTYYIVGKYIMDYKLKVNKLLLSIILILCLLYQAVRVYFTGMGQNFYSQGTIYADNGDLITIITAVILFLMLYNIKCNNKVIRGVMASVASLSLSVYLLSWIGDQFIYKNIAATLTNGFIDYPLAYLVRIPLHFIACIVAAYAVGIPVKAISKFIMNLFLNHSIVGFFKNRKKKESEIV